ncbi:uncharacterized protein LOC126967948 [Leptidea sinapis]|uniref:uncharacterized protein LOC126967948 n=1 Tax=Leptidea sinapis TaxID=189913 RepID=UPI0021C2A9B3|nr:uncharacterized protein LOC126967948 [Leptidea sinapis]
MGLRLECKTRRFITDETQELHFRTEIQNRVYKKEVLALDKEISKLEKLLAKPVDSDSNTSSIKVNRRMELNTLDEESQSSGKDKRTPSISGGLPMLLLSVLPPVIPRASWPSTEACRGRNSVTFSSQPKLNRKSQQTIDLYNLCLNKREDNHSIFYRIKCLFGSRASCRKASTISIADPTGQSIAAALKMQVGMIAGFMPNRKQSIVRSCNTLNVPNLDMKLRRETFARSGPIIHITDEPSCSKYDSENLTKGKQKYVAEPETRVNFVLPLTHKQNSNISERIKGSPRFPHRISPTASSLTTLDRRKTSGDSEFNLSSVFDENRRHSHQNVVKEHDDRIVENKWKSTEDEIPGPSSRI